MRDEIVRWLDSISDRAWTWYAKRLSANDSGATGSNVAGIYIPKEVLWEFFPSLRDGANPSAEFSAAIMPHNQRRTLRAVWYNQATRNETRITRWNTPSRILDPDLTGALVVIAFRCSPGRDAQEAAIWFCQSSDAEAAVENRIGIVEPGEGVTHHPAGIASLEQDPSPQLAEERPVFYASGNEPMLSLLQEPFPPPEALVRRAIEMEREFVGPPDARLLKRRDCETALFYNVENKTVLPRVRGGFRTVDEFVGYANSVANRRKSRSGMSLELHLREIFKEEKLPFSHGEFSEGQKRPDFLFPSAEAYRNRNWPVAKLRMLAAKTTCKDRWRQILNEADRIREKHLITLQEGVSENQFREMRIAGVVLVVPLPLHKKYPTAIRGNLMTLQGFIAETARTCV